MHSQSQEIQGQSRTTKVLALSLGQALSTGVSLLTLMVATRYLSKHDYATYRQTFLAFDFIAPLLMLGLPNALMFFLPRSAENKRGVILDFVLLLTCAGLAFSIFLACGGSKFLAIRFSNPQLNETLQWLILYPLLVMPTAVMSSTLVYAGRTVALATFNTISAFASSAFLITAVLNTDSFRGLVVARLVVSASLLGPSLWLIWKSVPGHLRRPSPRLMLNTLRYSVPLALASMLGSLTLQLHTVIVSSLCTPEEFAIYINGAIELPLIGIITGSITTIVFSEMADLCHNGRKAEALRLFKKAAVRSATILFPITCFLLVVAKPLIILLFSENYKASVVPFTIYLLVLPVRIVVYGSALMALGMTRTILFRSVLDLGINAILSFLMVRAFGYLGGAISLIFTLYLWSAPYNLAKIARGFGVSFFDSLPLRSLSKLAIISCACLPLAALPFFTGIKSNILLLLLAGVLYWPVVICCLLRFNFVNSLLSIRARNLLFPERSAE